MTLTMTKILYTLVRGPRLQPTKPIGKSGTEEDRKDYQSFVATS
jgi:hypothetical protein